MQGFAGDTLASALLANGVHLVGRSFKYHRPRGILAAGSEEPNALVTVQPRRGALHPEPARHPGRAVRRLDRREPESLAEPAARLRPHQRSAVARSFPPASTTRPSCGRSKAWKALYEPLIRRAAGLGERPPSADPDRYAQRYAHCDVLVVGAGPAGIAAALAAARRRRPRHPVRRDRRNSAAACWRTRRRASTGRAPA